MRPGGVSPEDGDYGPEVKLNIIHTSSSHDGYSVDASTEQTNLEAWKASDGNVDFLGTSWHSTASTNSWLKYTFASLCKVTRVKIMGYDSEDRNPRNIDIRHGTGGADNIDLSIIDQPKDSTVWHEYIFAEPIDTHYLVFYCLTNWGEGAQTAIKEFEIYGHVLEDIYVYPPSETHLTSAHSDYVGTTGTAVNVTGGMAWEAFDMVWDYNSSWYSNGGAGAIQYDFNFPVYFTSFRSTTHNGNASSEYYNPRSGTIQASNNGTDWTVIGTYADQGPTSTMYTYMYCAEAFTSVKFVVDEINYGTNNVIITELYIYGNTLI